MFVVTAAAAAAAADRPPPPPLLLSELAPSADAPLRKEIKKVMSKGERVVRVQGYWKINL